jgi:hypothetical protein
MNIINDLSPTPPPGGRGYYIYNQIVPPSLLGEGGQGDKAVNIKWNAVVL